MKNGKFSLDGSLLKTNLKGEMWHKPFTQGKAREHFTCELAEMRPSCATRGGKLHKISSHVATCPETTVKFKVLIKSKEIK